MKTNEDQLSDQAANSGNGAKLNDVEGSKNINRPSQTDLYQFNNTRSSASYNNSKADKKFLKSVSQSFKLAFVSISKNVKSFTKTHRLASIIIGVAILVGLIITGVSIYNYATRKTVPISSVISSQFRDQLPSLKKAVDAKPNDTTAHKNYAVALYATGSLNEAATQYQKAIDINENDATAYNNLANVYRDLRDYDKAIKNYNKSISINSNAINPYVNLANVQMYNLNKIDDGIATYKKALKALPNNTQIELLMGVAYETKSDKANAKDTYNTILVQDSTNAAAKARLKSLK